MEVSISQELWCLYNSSFFKIIMSLVSFGSIPFILPKLFSDFKKKESLKPRANFKFNNAVKKIIPFGFFTLISSISTIIFYVLIYFEVNGNIKCEKLVNSVIQVNQFNIIALFVSSLFVLILMGFFYHYWRIIEKATD